MMYKKNSTDQPQPIEADVYEAIKEIRAAFFKINEVFSNELSMTDLSDKYPFDRCFTELTHEVAEWCDDMIEKIIVE